ncbi:S-formylglutathione hydrolase [Reinekea blandensis]|uniref:S-formylglutathione hydrolase n=1 Tax=Reinekea blandensis MED297 TaxID=314283 RepID=A4BAT7_9GAMM|nr:S-formylglutathione hydrolase [Reinekea blandensis]EAR10550.1 Carboxylesterase [Reinekea sp. MED297] [Reinekea blandensis MED297]
MTLELEQQIKSAGGWLKKYRHQASSTGCQMRFNLFLPPQANEGNVPVLYWLSGLTCNEDNFMQKAGAHRLAAELGIALVAPDTSPRGDAGKDAQGRDIMDADRYDLGQGAGFYVNATEPSWSAHYQMYQYIVDELPALLAEHFPITDRKAIAGHSMGGHGAISIALKNPDQYASVSAFSPITNPSRVPWGETALTTYLGTDKTQWQQYDSVELLNRITDPTGYPHLLVDQGLADEFLEEQLKPQQLETAARQSDYPLTLRRHPGYDHSYYFIASFIDDHLHFHAHHLFDDPSDA